MNMPFLNVYGIEESNIDVTVNVKQLSTNELINIIANKELIYLNLYSDKQYAINEFRTKNEYYLELLNRENVESAIVNMIKYENDEKKIDNFHYYWIII